MKLKYVKQKNTQNRNSEINVYLNNCIENETVVMD